MLLVVVFLIMLQLSKSILPRVTRCKSTRLFSTQVNGPPPEPVNYGKDFFLIRPEDKMKLEIDNPHPLDSGLSFDEESHTYYLSNQMMKYSVTELVGNYFDKFEPDIAIERMMSGPRWPRPEYQHKADGRPFTPEEIKQQWENIGEYARNRGTWMHYNIERHLNGLESSEGLIEFKQFLDFERDIVKPRGVKPLRTEWRIADPEHNIAGSVDFIGSLPDGTCIIMDWKRSKNLATGGLNNSYGRRAKYPIDHLDDCEASKYFLQLNLYRYILQKHYNMVVSQMILTSFHPQVSNYFMVECPYWDAEVEKVLEDLKSTNGQDNIVKAPEGIKF